MDRERASEAIAANRLASIIKSIEVTEEHEPAAAEVDALIGKAFAGNGSSKRRKKKKRAAHSAVPVVGRVPGGVAVAAPGHALVGVGQSERVR